jgi:hypothetical protein
VTAAGLRPQRLNSLPAAQGTRCFHRAGLSPLIVQRSLARASAVIALIALSGCADKSPPLESSYCRLYQRLPDPADAVHMKKRENKLAILANEQTANECTGSSGLVNGPR